MKKADDVEVQWAKWLENNPPESFEDVNEEELRERTIRELTYVSQMDVKEYTLYQKWCEIKEKYPKEEVNDKADLIDMICWFEDEFKKDIVDEDEIIHQLGIEYGL